jgi:hypothetical protein
MGGEKGGIHRDDFMVWERDLEVEVSRKDGWKCRVFVSVLIPITRISNSR